MLIIDIIDFVETKTRSRRNIYHNIEIPRPKCHVIEITEPKNHDIEIQQLKHHNIEKPRQLSHNILIPRHFFRGQKAMTSRFQDWKTTTSRLQDQNATTLVFCGILTLMPPRYLELLFLLEGIRVRIPQKYDFLVLESPCCCFLSSEKKTLDHDVKACCLCFLIPWCCSPWISMSWFLGLIVKIVQLYCWRIS